MSSLWDSLAGKLATDNFTFEELADLLEFVQEFDAANGGLVANYLKVGYLKFYYKFTDYKTLEHDVQNKGISKEGLGAFISELHDIDHAIDQVMMYTYNPGKHEHYWVKRKSFKSMMGTFKEGKWQKRLRKP